jgi:hypothetical protein
MKIPLIEFAANCACCCDGNRKSKQLLINGGFESFQIQPYEVGQGLNPPETRYYEVLLDGNVPGWSATNPGGGDAGLLIQNNGALQSFNLDLQNCFNSPEGNQFVRLYPGGVLLQTISLEINKRYSFSFLQSGYFNDPDTAFGQAGADVGVTLSGPDNSVVFDAYVIDPELGSNGTGTSPIWRRVKTKDFQVLKPGAYALAFTCGSEQSYENVPASAFIDAVCLTESIAS